MSVQSGACGVQRAARAACSGGSWAAAAASSGVEQQQLAAAASNDRSIHDLALMWERSFRGRGLVGSEAGTNPQFGSRCGFESRRERECFWHLAVLSTLDVEDGCAQHEAGAGGGGGLAGIAQWERRGLQIEWSRVRFRSLAC